MAQLLDTQQIGIKEQWADKITMADFKGTPVKALLPKGSDLYSMLLNWPVDKYADPDISGVLATQDVDSFENAFVAEQRLQAYAQKLRRTASVDSIVADINEAHGIPKRQAMKKSVAKKLVELGRDVEAMICSNVDTRLEAGTDSYLNRGLFRWASPDAQGTLPVHADYRPGTDQQYTRSLAAMDEDDLIDLGHAQFNKVGGERDYMAIFGSDLKKKISQFTTMSQPDNNNQVALRAFNDDIDMKRIVRGVDIIDTEFAKWSMVLHNFLDINAAVEQQRRNGIVFDVDFLELRWAIMPKFNKIEDGGGGPRGRIDTALGLCVKSPMHLVKFQPAA